MSKLIKNINNNGVIKFSCDPCSMELHIFIGLSFYFNKDTNLFEVDQNPYGECDLICIKNLKFASDFSNFSVECRYQDDNCIFNIRVKTEKEKNIVRFIYENHGINSNYFNKSYQRISYSSEIKETSLWSNYRNPKNPQDYLIIFIKNGDFFYIISDPWKRLHIKAFNFIDNQIDVITECGTFKFNLLINSKILSIIEKLIKIDFLEFR